jgi:hypothetical protein
MSEFKYYRPMGASSEVPFSSCSLKMYPMLGKCIIKGKQRKVEGESEPSRGGQKVVFIFCFMFFHFFQSYNLLPSLKYSYTLLYFISYSAFFSMYLITLIHQPPCFPIQPNASCNPKIKHTNPFLDSLKIKKDKKNKCEKP